MRQRLLPKAGFSVSELGLGCEHLQGKDEGLIREVVGAAVANLTTDLRLENRIL